MTTIIILSFTFCWCRRFFLGNPGDYAWGREGLDAIVTQLLNQMDVAGPPPLDKDKIKEIQTSAITQEQAGKTYKTEIALGPVDSHSNGQIRFLNCQLALLGASR